MKRESNSRKIAQNPLEEKKRDRNSAPNATQPPRTHTPTPRANASAHLLGVPADEALLRPRAHELAAHRGGVEAALEPDEPQLVGADPDRAVGRGPRGEHARPPAPPEAAHHVRHLAGRALFAGGVLRVQRAEEEGGGQYWKGISNGERKVERKGEREGG